MYKVLLVDDEKTILQGISTLVEWEKNGARLIGTAMNGQQAYEIVEREAPDIIITDVKMPVMNGLELIKRVKANYPKTRFMILSGYEEFDFAKQAMEHEVKYYLLKPCNHMKIAEVLSSLVNELQAENEKEAHVRHTAYQLEKALPQIKEQFLKECLTNKAYGAKDWDSYQALFRHNPMQSRVKIILLALDQPGDFIYLFALKNIANEVIEQSSRLLMTTTLDGRVVVLIEDEPNDGILEALKRIQKVYGHYYGCTLSAAVSDAGGIAGLRRLYQHTMESLSHRFYYGNGSLLTPMVRDSRPTGGEEPQFDHEHLAYALRSGNVRDSEQYVDQFFQDMKAKLYDIEFVKTYSVELYMIVIRQADSAQMEAYFKRIVRLQQLGTMEQINRFVGAAAREIAQSYYDSQLRSQSRIVQRMVQYVHDHLDDESISLLKLANEVMFMNADYLGRLFKKETGERFTNYLVYSRIEQAKKLLESGGEIAIADIAAKVGFGNNPKYFSQVFKKETGYTPSDYKCEFNKSDFQHRGWSFA